MAEIDLDIVITRSELEMLMEAAELGYQDMPLPDVGYDVPDIIEMLKGQIRGHDECP